MRYILSNACVETSHLAVRFIFFLIEAFDVSSKTIVGGKMDCCGLHSSQYLHLEHW